MVLRQIAGQRRRHVAYARLAETLPAAVGVAHRVAAQVELHHEKRIVRTTPCYGWRVASILICARAVPACAIPLLLSLTAQARPLPTHSPCGPFLDVESYCAQRHETCQLNESWTADKQPISPSPLAGVRLFTTDASIATLPTKRCHIGIRTERGWFIADIEGTCSGALGPSSSIRITRAVARLLDSSSSPRVAVDFTVEKTVEATSRKAGRTSIVRTESHSVVLCGWGPRQSLRCTDPILLGCTDDGGTMQDAAWTLAAGHLRLSGAPQHASCLLGSELEMGDYQIHF